MEIDNDNSEVALTQLVLDELLRGVNDGDYQPGDRIVASRLCEQLGLSLAPVREALHVLAGQGVVMLLRNRGAVLRAISRQDVIDFWPVISAPASLSIRLATINIDRDDNADRVRAEMQKVIENTHKATSLNFFIAAKEYHWLLNEIADNPFIETLFSRYFLAYWERFVGDALPMHKYADEYIHNYQRMTESILVGDSPSATSIWSYHVEWSMAILRGDEVEPGKPWIR